MAIFNKFNSFPVTLGKGEHDFPNNQLAMLLTNVAPNADTMFFEDDITEIAGGGTTGYTVGGNNVTFTSWDDSDVAGIAELVMVDLVFTAGADTMGAFQYAVLVDKSNASSAVNNLIGWYNYGSSITLQDGETFTVDFDDGTGNGALTITA